jgi:excisionase family DNA binding protein
MENNVKQMYRLMFREYPDVLDVEQVGRILNVSRKTVYRLMKSGELFQIKVGREYRVPKIVLMQYFFKANVDTLSLETTGEEKNTK